MRALRICTRCGERRRRRSRFCARCGSAFDVSAGARRGVRGAGPWFALPIGFLGLLLILGGWTFDDVAPFLWCVAGGGLLLHVDPRSSPPPRTQEDTDESL